MCSLDSPTRTSASAPRERSVFLSAIGEGLVDGGEEAGRGSERFSNSREERGEDSVEEEVEEDVELEATELEGRRGREDMARQNVRARWSRG